MLWIRCLPFLIFYPAVLTAGEAPLSLDAAVELALVRAPELTAGAERVVSMRSLAVSAGRLPDPALIVGIDNLPVDGPDAWSVGTDFMTMRRIGLMQEFPGAGKRQLARERAVVEADLASAELAATRIEIARDAARAWIRRATAERSLQTLQTLRDEVELGAAAARTALAAGRGTSADALAAEAAAAGLENRILQWQGRSRQAQAELARWVGAEAGHPLAPIPAFDRLPAPPSAMLATIEEHEAILPVDSRLAAARTELAIAQAERNPDWSAELVYARRGPDFSNMASLQVTVDLPIFPGKRQNPRIAAVGAEVRRVEAVRDALLRMHGAELERMLIDWEQLGDRLGHYDRELLPLARERSRATLAAYRAGSADLRQALDAFKDEIELLVEHASLTDAYGQAWAYLRYLQAQHLHT